MLGILLICLIGTASAASPIVLPIARVDNLSNISYADYILPTTTIPSRYALAITVPAEALLGGSTLFTGSVVITLSVIQPTNVLRLHSLVNISNVALTLSTDLTYTNQVINTTVDSITETVSILFTTNLTINTNYNLHIDYSANLDTVNMKGFYRSQYMSGNVTEYLATTQFQSTEARRAFPCFDEPQYKATFALTLTYPLQYDATSNTPIVSSLSTATIITRTFTETPQMSTYLLAFTISKFTCSQGTTGGIPFGVCSRPDFATDRAVALQYGIEILEALNTWTNIPYNTNGIGKMDQFAIPDFSAGAMENWGKVNYREYLLLYNQAYTSNIYLQRLVSVIAHEFTHMWFGNLVTTKWWDTTFLNEGFARYFQYFLVNQIPSFTLYEMNKQFIIEQQQTALIEDGYLTSTSLTSEAWTPSQISNKFGTISYNKGASIIRMIENFLGATNFQTAVQNYLTANSFQSATPDLLWAAFSNVVMANTLPGNATFSQIIDNWANKAGFPVVSANLINNSVQLTQKRFLYSGTDNTQWYVPVTYIVPGSRSLTTQWLEPNTTGVLLNDIVNNTWIILNHDSRGFYRVHYDNTLRDRIVSALEIDHTQFSDLNRAQVIDDALNLAQARHITYTQAFRFLNYLKNETSYYPWYAAIRGLNYLSVRLGNSSVLGNRINGMLLDLVENISANVSTTSWAVTEQSDVLKLQLVWTAACRSGQLNCITETRRLFEEFRVNGTSIDPNLRDIVYCNALRYSTDINTDWNFLWSRLNSLDQPHENLYILLSLGCTTSREHLTYLLSQSLNPSSVIRIQDMATVWSSVYASSSVGLEVAFDYFTNNYTTILEYYPRAISILPNIVTRFTSNAEIIKLQQFIGTQAVNTTIRSVAESALAMARQNIQWQSGIQGDLNQHFGISTYSSASTFGVSLYLLLFVVFFI